MSNATYSRKFIDFLLYKVFDVTSLTSRPYFAGHDRQSLDLAIDTAERIAAKYLRPYFRESDRHPPVLKDSILIVHPAIAGYYRAFSESGLMASTLESNLGGQQLPATVYAAVDFVIGNAHNAFEMFTSLATGAIKLLATLGSEQQRSDYIPKILSGHWSASMCLTEPQAGSSLGEIRTIARRSGSAYLIKGQKIFISAGDHNATENILHLVLARVDGAPDGAQGLSLFAIPKRRHERGQLVNNDVQTTAVIHKMGQRATPAVQLIFGENDQCQGTLIGQEQRGLSQMFQLMNYARLNTGLAGTYIATHAYHISQAYASERLQGRDSNGGNRIPIIQHADVRRMLLTQKSLTEGGLSLAMQCYYYQDLLKVCPAQEKEKYTDLLELLTPVAKTCCSENAIRSVSLGMQVMGGYGYTEDFVMEQLLRDVRIMSIYEGTTGVQSIALLGRQIPANGARSFHHLKDEVTRTIKSALEFPILTGYATQLSAEMQALEETTQHLLEVRDRGNTEIYLSDATLYMELFGLVAIGWQWLVQAAVAEREKGAAYSSPNAAIPDSTITCLKFYFHYELPKTRALHDRLREEVPLTLYTENEILT